LIVEAAKVALSTRMRCPRYMSALESAAREEPLACGTSLYTEMYVTAAENGQWMVLSLLRRSSGEADEAKRLWARAAGCGDSRSRQHLKRSAVERSGHVLVYLSLIDLAFPDALTPQFRKELGSLAPGYTLDQPLPDSVGSGPPLSPAEVVLLNLEGLRKTVLGDLQRSAITQHCPADDHPRVAAVLDALRRDHLDQVSRTAWWIELVTEPGGSDGLTPLFISCLRRFNRATAEEAIDLSYHQRFGNYP
jgi:hypothetical protein